MSRTSLYVKEGNTLRLQGRGNHHGWQIIGKTGETAIPSPLNGMSVYLPSVVGKRDNQEKVFQQVSPKFWLMVNHE